MGLFNHGFSRFESYPRYENLEIASYRTRIYLFFFAKI